MDDKFIRERISLLRTNLGISEYKMSLDLGHSKSYVQSISSGKSLPSLSEFLYICEYLGVTPREFFNAESSEPQLVHELTEQVAHLSKSDLALLVQIADRLGAKK